MSNYRRLSSTSVPYNGLVSTSDSHSEIMISKQSDWSKYIYRYYTHARSPLDGIIPVFFNVNVLTGVHCMDRDTHYFLVEETGS